jgi:hypothetical protein
MPVEVASSKARVLKFVVPPKSVTLGHTTIIVSMTNQTAMPLKRIFVVFSISTLGLVVVR